MATPILVAMRKTLSVIVSSYNEEGNVAELHRRLKKVAGGLPVETVEIIFVDDGSTDATLARCREIQAGDPNVKIISMFRNFGHEAAMVAGMDSAAGDAVIFMDGDLQHPPECIAEMVDLWLKGNDIVLTRRTDNAGTSWLYKTLAKVFYRALNALSDARIPSNAPDFRLLGRKYVNALRSFNERDILLRGVLSLVMHVDRTPVVEFAAPERFSGESKYNFRKSVNLALNSMLQFSVKPLFLSMWLALATAVFAVVLGADVLLERFVLQNPTPGYATIVMTTLIMGMANLITLAILGAYVAKIHIETKKRPLYLADFITADGGSVSISSSSASAENQVRTADACSK